MKTSSERLSSCGATGRGYYILTVTNGYLIAPSSLGSQQALFSSTGSFRRPSVKSLGSGIGEWSAGLGGCGLVLLLLVDLHVTQLHHYLHQVNDGLHMKDYTLLHN